MRFFSLYYAELLHCVYKKKVERQLHPIQNTAYLQQQQQQESNIKRWLSLRSVRCLYNTYTRARDLWAALSLSVRLENIKNCFYVSNNIKHVNHSWLFFSVAAPHSCLFICGWTVNSFFFRVYLAAGRFSARAMLCNFVIVYYLIITIKGILWPFVLTQFSQHFLCWTKVFFSVLAGRFRVVMSAETAYRADHVLLWWVWRGISKQRGKMSFKLIRTERISKSLGKTAKVFTMY